MRGMKAPNPFTTSPNPAYLYLTDSLHETLDKTRYVIDERQGLTVIYGEVGHGKSTVIRYLYNEYADREDCAVALLPNPDYDTGLALLKAICGEFGIPRKRAKLDQQEQLQKFLLEQYEADKNVIVFVDEAQTLKGRVLELVRTLLNFETDSTKLVQIVLCGQLELHARLADPSKKALRSRIFLQSTLDPLTLADTANMIEFRCERVKVRLPFDAEAIEAIFRLSRGVPRDVLKLAGTAWKLAQNRGLGAVPLAAIEAAARTVPLLVGEATEAARI